MQHQCAYFPGWSVPGIAVEITKNITPHVICVFPFVLGRSRYLQKGCKKKKSVLLFFNERRGALSQIPRRGSIRPIFHLHLRTGSPVPGVALVFLYGKSNKKGPLAGSCSPPLILAPKLPFSSIDPEM